jgi:hypothetical protein
VGANYSQALAALGGPTTFSYSVTLGALPPGLTLDAASGLLSGMPTATGLFPFTVTAVDSTNDQGSQAYNMTIGSRILLAPTVTLNVSGGGYAGQATTLTATVTGSGSPTGTVQFSDGATVLGTAPLADGQAALATAGLAQGSHAFTAQYGGNATFAANGSETITLAVAAPALGATLTAQTLTLSASGSAGTQLVLDCQGTPGGLITLSATGLPAGLTLSFSATSFSASALPANVQVQVGFQALPASRFQVLGQNRHGSWLGGGGALLACGMLTLPGGRRRRRRLVRILALVLAALGLSCGSNGSFSSPPAGSVAAGSYPVTIIASATGTTSASPVLTVIVP